MSSLAGGKRIGQVEDVLDLGQAIEVRVDDIDPQGKVSLSLAGAPESSNERSDEPARERAPREPREPRDDASAPTTSSSFEDSFEAELEAELGDLGPGAPTPTSDGGGRSRSRGRRR
jgi:polyribonucleotide nucleotidyltransferase